MARAGTLGRSVGALGLVLGVFGVGAGTAQAPSPRAVADGVQYDGALVANDEIAVYRGIPYALPPVGKLRWQPPEPLRPSAGNRSARAFGPACMQGTRLDAWTRGIAAVFGSEAKVRPDGLAVSEDCLFLNVWTAATPRSLAPVMVWIHGGSNLDGSGASSWYDGTELARRGVVVVTINYRLGVFGFLADSALIAESPKGAAGNYGLQDQLEALRWVRRNIRGFGGDPDRVTVFGESAGSIDLVHLMASPESRGLFHRAIAQSGAPMSAMADLAGATRTGALLARTLGVDSAKERLAALRSLPADSILAGQTRMQAAGWLASPNVDGWILPDVTARVFEKGEQLEVPLIIGTNALEMSTLRGYLPRFPRTIAGFRAWAGAVLGAAAPRAFELYPVAADSLVEPVALDLVTDLFFTCPARIVARAMAPAGRVYQYQFTRVLPGGESLGAFHGQEISYAFGVPLPWLPRLPVDQALSEQMMDYWTRFAATGDPSGGRSIPWPAFGSGGKEYYLELGDRVLTRTDLRKERCDALETPIRATWQKR